MMLLLIVLMLGCATTPPDHVRPDEVRLTDMEIIKTDIHGGAHGSSYKAIIRYRHGAEIAPGDITSVCTTWTWLGDV